MIDYDPHDWRSHFFDIKGSMLREIMVRAMAVAARRRVAARRVRW
jgi:ion channel-forming bestrophin family protein